MQLIKITLLALISLSSATPAPVKRTAAQIESTLTNIISDLTIFDSRVNSFNNGFLQVFFLELAAENVVTDFNTLNTQVVSTGTLTTAESSTIAGQVDTLTALLITILTDVITKEPVVEGAGKKADVHDALEDTRASHQKHLTYLLEMIRLTFSPFQDSVHDFYDNLELTIDSSELADIITDQIDADAKFAAAITAYA